jgi:hypothetical protein
MELGAIMENQSGELVNIRRMPTKLFSIDKLNLNSQFANVPAITHLTCANLGPDPITHPALFAIHIF